MKRFFTFLMTTLVLLAVSTQGAKAFEYWIMGDLAQTSGDKWTHANCKANDANKFTANGSIWTYTFTAENSTVLYFRIAAGEGYKNGEMLYPKDNASFTMSEGTTYGVGYATDADKSWGINVTAGQSYEITLDETDTSNRKISYKKAAAQVKFALNIDGATSSENTDGKFSLDLTSETANKTITFTVNGESYGLSAPATVSAAGPTYWTFENGKTNALTLSKGLSYALTLTPTTRAAKASTAASVYTLTVVATLPTFDDYYLIGRIYGTSTWSNRNEDGMKFTSTDGKIYTRSVLCTADNNDFSFRIGTPDNSVSKQLYPDGKPSTPQTTPTGGITKGKSDNYWKLDMEANNLYTFTLDMTDKANPTLKYEVEAVSGEYEMVATCGTETLVLPLSQARIRNLNDSETKTGLADGLWTVGFKDDQLVGKQGDVFQVYIRDKKAHDVQFRPAATTSGYGNFDRTMGNSQVEDLRLDYTNLQYFGNAVYADPTSGSVNTFSIKKGDGKSYMFMLNLGNKIDKGGDLNGYSFEHAAKSVSLFVYGSLSDTYRKLSVYKGLTRSYDEKTEDFYLVGKIYGSSYQSGITEGKDNNKMIREVYLRPNNEEVVDSIVYSKIVRRPEGAASFNGIFLSFVPAFFYETGMADKTKGIENGGTGASKSPNNAWNYIARAATFDEKDATAPTGTVMVRGVDHDNLYQNGEQAINPLLDATQSAAAYYIVRFNVTTSTYRIEFVNDPKLTLSHVQTFCSQANLKLNTTEVENYGVHAYVVHSFEKKSEDYVKKQGTLNLRSLEFIPANMGVVLYCDKIPEGTTVADIPFSIITDADNDEAIRNMLNGAKETWWKKASDYKNAEKEEDRKFQNYLVACFDNTTIENGIWSMEGDKYKYAARNFALNKYFNTKHFKYDISEAERQELKKDEATNNYYSFFRAKGKVPGGRAYLQLPSSVMDFDGQLLDHVEDDEANFAKMSLFFDDLGGDITGIQEVNSNVAPREDGAYYTLQGMKVEKPVKGLYIHNGKKVIIK